eukprot:1052295-Amorphochlora_amoeboformis.AAC.1
MIDPIVCEGCIGVCYISILNMVWVGVLEGSRLDFGINSPEPGLQFVLDYGHTSTTYESFVHFRMNLELKIRIGVSCNPLRRTGITSECSPYRQWSQIGIGYLAVRTGLLDSTILPGISRYPNPNPNRNLARPKLRTQGENPDEFIVIS